MDTTCKVNWIVSDNQLLSHWIEQKYKYVVFNDRILPVYIEDNKVVCQDEILEDYQFVEPIKLVGRIFVKGEIINRISDLEIDYTVINNYLNISQ